MMQLPDFTKIPHAPGCYMYKDSVGIIYIGKAKDLRKRITQYFQRDLDEKTAAMISSASIVEWVITKDENDALILESRLIRQHKPKYNIDLKENIRYSHLALTNEEYPRLITIRSPSQRSSDVFGPFTDGTQRIELQNTTRKLFKLRVCMKMPKKLCLYYYIGQCSGPCEGKISKDEYDRNVGRARLFLKGRSPQLIVELDSAMKTASADMRFEDAKQLRDTIRAIHWSSDRSLAGIDKNYDEDVIVSRLQSDSCQYMIMKIKKGMIMGTEEFSVGLDRINRESIMDDFVKAYYQERSTPSELILENELADDGLRSYLENEKNMRVVVPKTGPKRALLDLAIKNIESRINKKHHLLLKVQETLRLPQMPIIIDAFDNSHIQGTNVVGACVRFDNTEPSKRYYRKFIIKEQKNDDFAAMKEAVTRRYSSAISKSEPLPQLILIDGGKGQLNAAYEALRDIGISIPVIGLAKKYEEVFVPGLPTPLLIERKSDISLLLQRIRDEIHRFVITFHRLRRGKSQIKSVLDDIVGVGEKTKFRLLKKFGSSDRIFSATDEELREFVSQRQLAAIRDYQKIHKQ